MVYLAYHYLSKYLIIYFIQWPPFLGTPGSATWKQCHGYPCSNAPSCVARFARAGTLAHVSCSHTPPALLLQVVRWPQGKVPAPHPANGVTSLRGSGRASWISLKLSVAQLQSLPLHLQLLQTTVSTYLVTNLLVTTVDSLWVNNIFWQWHKQTNWLIWVIIGAPPSLELKFIWQILIHVGGIWGSMEVSGERKKTSNRRRCCCGFFEMQFEGLCWAYVGPSWARAIDRSY